MARNKNEYQGIPITAMQQEWPQFLGTYSAEKPINFCHWRNQWPAELLWSTFRFNWLSPHKYQSLSLFPLSLPHPHPTVTCRPRSGSVSCHWPAPQGLPASSTFSCISAWSGSTSVTDTHCHAHMARTCSHRNARWQLGPPQLPVCPQLDQVLVIGHCLPLCVH